jgi:hypothetical protein
MNPKKIVLTIVFVSFLLTGVAFLNGCSTIGVSFDTEYGRFSYTLPELPKPEGTKK